MVKEPLQPIRVDGLYFGELAQKLALARALHASHGRRLLCDPAIDAALRRLREAARAIEALMAALGLPALCATCGARPGGGCCSAMMADEADAPLLLTNLLLGCEALPLRDDGVECRFLGPRGCSLAIKPLFCLDFNCDEIRRGPGFPALRRATGDLLRAYVDLEGLLVARIA
jgi:hypothetical protein